MNTTREFDKDKAILVITPHGDYMPTLIECSEKPHTVTPLCPVCKNDESMIATFDVIVYENLAQTRFYQGYRCADDGAEVCLTYLQDDGKLT